MAEEPEALYRQLGQLVADMPRDLYGPAPIGANTHAWLGRAAVAIERANQGLLNTDRISFNSAADHLNGALREMNAHQIVSIMHRALARVEQDVPAAAQGAFIPVGAGFDIFRTIGNVLREARVDILIVDAYMGATVLTDFAPLSPDGVTVRLLSDSHYTQPATLQPGVDRWRQQFGAGRLLDVRLTTPRMLHDRLIVIDNGKVWSLSQSLKDFSARSPGTVLRIDDESIAQPKREAYGNMWAGATPI